MIGIFIIGIVVLKPSFWQDLRSLDRHGCLYCWIASVIAPWVLLACGAALSFSGAANLQSLSAILMLLALILLAGREVLLRLK
jgi:hypothetical protein